MIAVFNQFPTGYNNPTPVAVALVRVGHGFLAVRRKLKPEGGVALPGGFVDENESAEQAVARELEEETGVTIDPAFFKPIATRCTPRNQLLIFMECSTNVGLVSLTPFVPNDEVSELLIVKPGDQLCFPLHTEILSRQVV